MKGSMTQTLGNLIKKITSGKTAASQQDKRYALDLSIKVMSLISVADGVVDDAEVKQVQEVYLAHAGSQVEPGTVLRAFQIAADDKQAIFAELRAASLLPEQIRADIFQAALEVAKSDQQLHDNESELLKQIGSMLELAPDLVEQQVS